MSIQIPAVLQTHPGTVTLPSPITGKLAIYGQNRVLQLAEPNSTFDTAKMRDDVNAQFSSNLVDGYCSDVRHYQSGTVDYIEVEYYAPEDIGTASAPVGTLLAGIVWIIIAIIVAAVATISGMAAWAHFFPAPVPFPDLYIVKNPITGQFEKMPRETAYTAQLANYPGMYVDPTTMTVIDPSSPNFDAIVAYLQENTPAGWGQPQGDNGIQNIIMAIVVGVGAIAAIYIGVKYIAPRLSKES